MRTPPTPATFDKPAILAGAARSDTTSGYTSSVNHCQRSLGARSCRLVSLFAAGVAFTFAAGAHAQDKPMDAATFVRDFGGPAEARDAGDKTPPKEAKKSPTEVAERGVVTILQSGKPVALGGVLARDGRVLTALSPLGGGNGLQIKFADNTLVDAKLGHHDRAWDLALLVPQSGHWEQGLRAGMEDPVRPNAKISSFSAARGNPAAAPMTLIGYRSLLGGDDASLPNALEIGSRVSPRDLGSPIIDEKGRVVGVVGRGCAPAPGDQPCTPVALGAPMPAVKAFLKSVPATAVAPAPWLGIQGVRAATEVARGVRVLSVRPSSPAHQAGIKAGDKTTADLILAIGGTPVITPEALAEAIKQHAVGEKISVTVMRDGKYVDVPVALTAAPTARRIQSDKKHPAALPDADAPKAH